MNSFTYPTPQKPLKNRKVLWFALTGFITFPLEARISPLDMKGLISSAVGPIQDVLKSAAHILYTSNQGNLLKEADKIIHITLEDEGILKKFRQYLRTPEGINLYEEIFKDDSHADLFGEKIKNFLRLIKKGHKEIEEAAKKMAVNLIKDETNLKNLSQAIPSTDSVLTGLFRIKPKLEGLLKSLDEGVLPEKAFEDLNSEIERIKNLISEKKFSNLRQALVSFCLARDVKCSVSKILSLMRNIARELLALQGVDEVYELFDEGYPHLKTPEDKANALVQIFIQKFNNPNLTPSEKEVMTNQAKTLMNLLIQERKNQNNVVTYLKNVANTPLSSEFTAFRNNFSHVFPDSLFPESDTVQVALALRKVILTLFPSRTGTLQAYFKYPGNIARGIEIGGEKTCIDFLSFLMLASEQISQNAPNLFEALQNTQAVPSSSFVISLQKDLLDDVRCSLPKELSDLASELTEKVMGYFNELAKPFFQFIERIDCENLRESDVNSLPATFSVQKKIINDSRQKIKESKNKGKKISEKELEDLIRNTIQKEKKLYETPLQREDFEAFVDFHIESLAGESLNSPGGGTRKPIPQISRNIRNFLFCFEKSPNFSGKIRNQIQEELTAFREKTLNIKSFFKKELEGKLASLVKEANRNRISNLKYGKETALLLKLFERMFSNDDWVVPRKDIDFSESFQTLANAVVTYLRSGGEKKILQSIFAAFLFEVFSESQLDWFTRVVSKVFHTKLPDCSDYKLGEFARNRYSLGGTYGEVLDSAYVLKEGDFEFVDDIETALRGLLFCLFLNKGNSGFITSTDTEALAKISGFFKNLTTHPFDSSSGATRVMHEKWIQVIKPAFSVSLQALHSKPFRIRDLYEILNNLLKKTEHQASFSGETEEQIAENFQKVFEKLNSEGNFQCSFHREKEEAPDHGTLCIENDLFQAKFRMGRGQIFFDIQKKLKPTSPSYD